MDERAFDVVVTGAGPAGLAAGAACAEHGLRVAIVAPDPHARWRPTYAAWVDEIRDAPVSVSWDRVALRFDRDQEHVEPRAYARIDGDATRTKLLDALGGAAWIAGTVVGFDRDGAHTQVRIGEPAQTVTAQVVIDARGAGPASAYQTAFGLVVDEVSGPLDPTMPLWMDFSTPFGDGGEVPSFLYALPYPDGSWLLEETVLTRAPAVPIAVLERRLEQRLRERGIRAGRIRETERVSIPLDAPVPPLRDGVIAFGAAGGMIHPASGYLVARVLRCAPLVASAIAAGLGGEGPAQATRRAYAAIWPDDALRRNRIHRYGASAIGRLGAADTRAFFAAFFTMPEPFRRGFLSDTLGASALVTGMAELFQRLPTRIRLRLLAAGNPLELVRALATTPLSPEVLR